MKRECIIIDKDIKDNIRILVDLKNATEILCYVNQTDVVDEFKQIRNIIKENLINKEKYKKIKISNKTDNIFEMRFVNKGKNDRIFCFEYTFSSKRHIVMVELQLRKKTQDIDKKQKSRINKIGGFEYEIKY